MYTRITSNHWNYIGYKPAFSARLVDEPFPWTEHRIRVWSFFYFIVLFMLAREMPEMTILRLNPDIFRTL